MAKPQTKEPKKSAAAKKDVNPVFDYITTEANRYQTGSVPLTDNWNWSMYEHIKRSFLYLNSKFTEGENDGNRPFKNIIRPIVNVAHRAEGFDVKDIIPFVDNDKDFDKSFLVKKFAHKWGIDNDLDTFIDQMVESYVDYGLAIVKNIKGKRPDVVPLQRIEFCDQTDVMTGPLCELHTLSIEEINKMHGKWDEKAINFAIEQAKAGKMVMGAQGQTAQTPGKYIEAHELHGTFPETWLNTYPGDPTYDKDNADSEYSNDSSYVKQLQIVGYYYNKDGDKCGITFFKGPERAEVYKAVKRDPIYGRACGMGGIEELFDPQQWTNMAEIQQQEMLEIASLLLLQVTEGSGKTKNILTELEKGQVLEHEDGKPYTQLSLTPQNAELFKESVDRWNQAARTIGSADEALLGQAPAAGTPFSLQALVVQQGFGLHDYRKGKLADFMGEIYRDWILDILVGEMKKGQKWLANLSLDELQGLVDNIVNVQTWTMIKEFLAKGQLPTQAQVGTFKQQARDGFMKDSKKFLQLIENEIDGIPVAVEVDVAGKQYNLQDRADKLTNIFRQIIANPQIFQVPGMAKLFNEIIESSGFSPVDFNGFTSMPAPVATTTQPTTTVQPQITPQPITK